MATVVRMRCDGCQREVALDSPELGHWMTLDVHEPREWRDAGHSYRYDLCSFACLERWSQRRHLPRGFDAHDSDDFLASVGL